MKPKTTFDIWSAAWFGPRTSPLPPLRCWPAAAGEATWSPSTLLCKQHSDLRFFLIRRMLTHYKSVCRSALMKSSPGWCPTGCSCQDWGALVFICSDSASDFDWSCSCRWHVCAVGTNSSTPGVYVDADVIMSAHVTAIVIACLAALCQIRSVRRSLTRTTLLTLVHALVVTEVDYCNSVLSGISGQLFQRLQSIFNAAGRLVFSARK